MTPVTTELRQRQERGEFAGIILEQRPRETAAQRMLAMEHSNLESRTTNNADTTKLSTKKTRNLGLFARSQPLIAHNIFCS
jgi:hypothetical protein